VQTAGSNVVRIAPDLVDSDIVVPWSIDGGYKSEWSFFRDLFSTYGPATTHRFFGYWGDEFVFRFMSLDQPTVKAGLWSFSGIFRVETIISYADTNADGGDC
jgi:hypothetical protein